MPNFGEIWKRTRSGLFYFSSRDHHVARARDHSEKQPLMPDRAGFLLFIVCTDLLMQKTCTPDVATESSPASFKIPQILYSDGIWRITSPPTAACACQQSVSKWFQVILTNSLMRSTFYYMPRIAHIPTKSCQALFFPSF